MILFDPHIHEVLTDQLLSEYSCGDREILPTMLEMLDALPDLLLSISQSLPSDTSESQALF
jgi:hypothetical protein